MLNPGRLLLGAFDDREHAVAFAQRVAIIEPKVVRARWAAARDYFLASSAPAPVETAPLDDATRGTVEEILSAPLFQSTLGERPWSLASVHAPSITALQPVVNLGRVAVMSDRLGGGDIIPILFPVTTALDVEPETAEGPTVSFISSRGELAVSGAEIRRANETAPIELTFRIEPRPNYVSVLAAGEQLVLRNGHHRLIAACQSGHAAVPMIVVEGNVETLAARIDGLPPVTKTGVRAATLSDFLAPTEATIDVELRPKRYALRLRVERETVYAG